MNLLHTTYIHTYYIPQRKNSELHQRNLRKTQKQLLKVQNDFEKLKNEENKITPLGEELQAINSFRERKWSD